MGKKVNPLAMRPNYKFAAWFTVNKKLFKNYVKIDYDLRQLAEKVLNKLNFAQIGIERIGIQTNVTIYTHKPGIIVGNRDGRLSLIEEYKAKIKEKILLDTPFIVIINDHDIKADSSAVIISNNLAKNVQDRMSYKSVTKKTIANFMRMHPEGGIKISWAGRVNGAEIARTEKFQDGKMPQSTIKENIDFAYSVAHTAVGTVTCKVHIHVPRQEHKEEKKRFDRPFERWDNRKPFERSDRPAYGGNRDRNHSNNSSNDRYPRKVFVSRTGKNNQGQQTQNPSATVMGDNKEMNNGAKHTT